MEKANLTPCEWCGLEFLPHRYGQMFCCIEHSKKAYDKAHPKPHRILHKTLREQGKIDLGPCGVCGNGKLLWTRETGWPDRVGTTPACPHCVRKSKEPGNNPELSPA